MRLLLTAGLCLVLATGLEVDAKCKAHHTSWKVASQGPLVSQPVSQNPERVKVSWSGLLANQRCVDWYTVSYWRTGIDNPDNPFQVFLIVSYLDIDSHPIKKVRTFTFSTFTLDKRKCHLSRYTQNGREGFGSMPAM